MPAHSCRKLVVDEQGAAESAYLHLKSDMNEQGEAESAYSHPKSRSNEQAQKIPAYPHKNPAADEQRLPLPDSRTDQSSIFVRNLGPSLVTTTVCSFWA